MKRICFYFESYYVGGLDTFVTQLINNWPMKGYSITLLCNRSHSGAALFEKNIHHPNATVELYDMCLHQDFAHAVCYNSKSPFYRAISAFSYVFLIPYYILFGYGKLKLNRFDEFMAINGGYPAALSCRCIPISWKLYTGKNFVLNFHSHGVRSNFFLRPFDYVIDKLVVKSVSDILSVSRICAESIRIRTPFRKLRNIHYIYNGIGAETVTPAFSLKKELGVAENTHILMMLSTYEPRKGHKHIISVLQRVKTLNPCVHLVFCGYGSDEDKEIVKQYAVSAGVADSVSILNFKPNGMEYMAQTDILLIGSQEFESFGLTAIEGMKYKKVVVSTCIGGLKEVIRDGEGGYLFDRDDVEGMAQKVVSLLEDPFQMLVQGEKGYQRYIQNFTIEKMVNGYVHYF